MDLVALYPTRKKNDANVKAFADIMEKCMRLRIVQLSKLKKLAKPLALDLPALILPSQPSSFLPTSLTTTLFVIRESISLRASNGACPEDSHRRIVIHYLL